HHDDDAPYRRRNLKYHPPKAYEYDSCLHAITVETRHPPFSFVQHRIVPAQHALTHGWNVIHNPDTQTTIHVSCDLHRTAIVPEKHEQNARHSPDKLRPIAIDAVVPWS
ncbi:hypothetical protein A2U01_0067006, partial [Trifolium medium]|nr:hypothetical protein [Trifolium medium]